MCQTNPCLYYAFGSPMPARGGVQKCSTVTVTTYTTNYQVNEDFNSGGVGGFTAPGGVSITNASNALHISTMSGPPKTTSVFTTVSGTTYTINLNITGIGTAAGSIRVAPLLVFLTNK